MSKVIISKVFLVALILMRFVCYGQGVGIISEEEYKNASFESLGFLKEELKDVKIVGLGESTHWLKKTYTSKVKMVKYLHENCGFDVIAFETPIYNLGLVNSQLKNGNATPTGFRRNNSGVWNFSELEELYEYIIETQYIDRPLIYAGFDESFFKSLQLKNDYSAFIDSLAIRTNSTIIIDSTFYNALERTANNSYSYRKISPADTVLLHDKLELIKAAYASLDERTVYFRFWNRLTENLQGLYRKSYQNANRDENMAANVSFLANDLYPGKKIMIWAATMHLIDNTAGIEVKHKLPPRMGYFLKNQFGDRYYIMAFSPYTGKGGVKGYLGLMTRKVKTAKRSIEWYVNDTYGCDYAFLSMRNDKIEEIVETEQINKANVVGLKPHKLKIPDVIDGLFYMKREAALKVD